MIVLCGAEVDGRGGSTWMDWVTVAEETERVELWSILMAPLRRRREASPVLTRSERTMESSASVTAGCGTDWG